MATPWLGRSKATKRSAQDAAIEAYLQQVGSRVATHARRRLPYTFHYIASPAFVNAFALPGGHVFVGRGLLQIIKSEDALAAVLGHEVEHIDLRHCAERAKTEARLRQLGPAGDLLSLPVDLFAAGYSKDQELEADRDGTTLAVQSGYSYTGILALFRNFAQLEAETPDLSLTHINPLSEATRLSLYTLNDYFRSHPAAAQRAEQVVVLARRQRWPVRTLQPISAAPRVH